jgi:hypothetical protein
VTQQRRAQEADMAIAAYFHPKDMTLAQFAEIHKRLDELGDGHNPHRLHHSCFGEDGDLMVYDIWDSPEAFQEFGAALMPILAEIGLEVPPPDILPIQRIIQTAHEE